MTFTPASNLQAPSSDTPVLVTAFFRRVFGVEESGLKEKSQKEPGANG